jgi:hypothetical protein
MTGPAAPHGMTSTLPPLSGLVAGFAVLVVAVIFITPERAGSPRRAVRVGPERTARTKPPACQARTPQAAGTPAIAQSRNGQPADPSAGAPAPADDSRGKVSRP